MANTTIQSSALDFNNIKNNLKTYLEKQDQFKDYNFEASGLSNILDVLAYNTHLNALIANFALNESFLGTAQLRSSIVSLAEGIGYIPDTDTSSQAKIRITFNSTAAGRDEKVTLPAYTKFTTSVDDVNYTFQTIQSYEAIDDGTGFYEFKTADGSNQIPIYEGTFKSKTFLVGEYEDNPVYVVPDGTLDADTVTVNIYESATSTTPSTYTNILNSTTISSISTVYILKETPNGYFELSFGDGETFGVAPSAGNRITIEYLSTSGADANGASTFSPSAQFSLGAITADLNVTTYVNSVGGEEKETIESIRKNAPFQYASQNRMVTAADYSSLILKNYSTLINDIISWGGQDALEPEFGAVFTSILFEDNVSADTIRDTKAAIINLAEQLAVTSFNLRFVDPETTYIELDTFYQFNPNLTDLTGNAVNERVRTAITNYFTNNTGKFGQSFRRSNLLSDIDEIDNSVLSSRSVVRMQRRFVPSAPNLISTINNLSIVTLLTAQLNTIINLCVSGDYDGAANYMVNNELTDQNFTTTRSTLSNVSISRNQTIRYPTAIAIPDDNEYTVVSNQFTYDGQPAILRNKLSSNIVQVVSISGGDVIVDNVGSYDAGAGTVVINYFNPTAIAGAGNEIKLAVTPSNPSAITPTRNELLQYDPNSSSVVAVTVSATN